MVSISKFKISVKTIAIHAFYCFNNVYAVIQKGRFLKTLLPLIPGNFFTTSQQPCNEKELVSFVFFDGFHGALLTARRCARKSRHNSVQT